MPLPRCFFDVSINNIPAGRVVFELFKDDCPKTVENFRCLCTGEKGEGPTTFKPLHYKGTPIHRIVKGFIIQGGDFSNGDGTGGESIYGGMFKDEGFKHKHDRPYLLSMANKGPHTNGSQFFITTRPAPHLDGIHVIFGHVIDGAQFVTEIENQKVDVNHRPYADVRITHCGELVLLKKGKAKKPRVEISSSAESSEDSSGEESSSESESESSEEERRRRRRRRKKKKMLKRKRLKEEERKERKKKKLKRRRAKEERSKKERRSAHKKKAKKIPKKVESSDESASDSEEDLSYSEPDKEAMVTSTVPEPELSASAAEEIPPEIRAGERTSWLYRRSRTPSPSSIRTGGGAGDGDEGAGRERRVVNSRGPPQSYKPHIVNRKNEVSQSGRRLKGRGVMRYKTPPRFGDDSTGGDDLRFELHSRHNPSGGGGSGPPQSSYPRGRRWGGGGGGGGGGFRNSSPSRYRRYRSRSRSRSRDRYGGRKRRRFSEHSNDRGRYGDGDRRRSGFEERPRGRGGGGRSRWDDRRRSTSRSDNERKRSHSPQSDKDDRRRGRSKSGSRSPSRDRGADGGTNREETGGKEGRGTEVSKWARHRDQKEEESGRGSSSEDLEDRELERAYQNAAAPGAVPKGGAGGGAGGKGPGATRAEEDLFGLDKILS